MQRYEQIRVGVSWRLVWFAILLGIFALSGIALNAAAALAHESEMDWDANYWDNMTLTGSPVISRLDTTLDFNWAEGSPGTGIPTDGFSARWERHLNIAADESGNYLFTAVIDDGVRVWVDGDLLIDSWVEQAETSYEAELFLAQGQHLVRVEYFEMAGSASISVSWARAAVLPTTYWQGEYFNNKSLEGTPQTTRGDARIDFDWGYESPLDGLNADGFSVRWSRVLQLPAGDYRFTATVDDGVRLFIENRTLIDAWQVQASATHSQVIYLDGSPVTVKMEYYEETGQAQAGLSWHRLEVSPTSTPASASTAAPTSTPPPTTTPTLTPTPTPVPTIVWQALYWNNLTLSGSPALAQQEFAINYDWGAGSPAPQLINTDGFSARWSGQISLEAGSYIFDVAADDGVRLFVNDIKRIDGWSNHPLTSYQTTMEHTGGTLNVVLEYYENTELAQVRLSWRSTADPTPEPSPTPTPTPVLSDSAVLVDDRDSGFQRGGTTSTWREADEGYAAHLYWTENNDKTRSGYNWGQWSPQLEAASYEVFVYIPENHTTTGNARYWISHAGGFTLREVDQSSYANQWVSLGTYTFSGTQEDYISLSDVTYETFLSTNVAWDAIKWEKR